MHHCHQSRPPLGLICLPNCPITTLFCPPPVSFNPLHRPTYPSLWAHLCMGGCFANPADGPAKLVKPAGKEDRIGAFVRRSQWETFQAPQQESLEWAGRGWREGGTTGGLAQGGGWKSQDLAVNPHPWAAWSCSRLHTQVQADPLGCLGLTQRTLAASYPE